MTTLGFAFTPTIAPERLVSVARAVEASGLDELWVWEDSFKESGVASAAIALASTESITVGIGLLPAPLRNVALTAMEFAVLGRAFPGRLIGGVGHGVQEWMGQAGVRVASPLTLLREYTDALRMLLAGESVTVEGRYVRLTGVRLAWPPLVPVPIMLGGGGPKSLALTGELGDGSMLTNALTDAEIADAADLIRSAVRARRGVGDAHPIVATIIAATGPNAQQRLDAELRTWGAAAGRGIGAGGSAHVIAQAIRRYAAAGASTVVVQATEDEPDLEGFIAFLGREVRPLLQAVEL